MRTLGLALTAAAFGLAVAAPVLTPQAALAAPKGHSMRDMRATIADMKAKDTQGYAACEQLARSRGYIVNDQMQRDVMMFIDGCMSDRFR